MPFKLPDSRPICPDDPEALFRDLRKRTVPGLLSHQADLLRSYLEVHSSHADIALQLPTGSGKTLVGLLIAEWRRRKYGERVVYLCPTRQLVNQVAQQAAQKYGIDLHSFTGTRAKYDASASADWQSAEAIAVTTYRSLFNTNPFFIDPNLIILDDAHSAENYISQFWSLLIERSNPEHEAAFSALIGIVTRLIPPSDKSRLAVTTHSTGDSKWVEKIPTPVFQSVVPEVISLLDEHTRNNDLKYSWEILRDSLHACHLYISQRSILIRPLIPPSNTHTPFAGAKQRLYMSATLGVGGDLERITGRQPIHKIAVPIGWDKQGIGRRFFIFPKRSLDDEETVRFTMEAIKIAGRALYIVPDDHSAGIIRQTIMKTVACPVFDATQIEISKEPFIRSGQAVAVIANRYDGIDLVDNECRILFADGLPGGVNLQERFFVLRVTAQLLLDDRILTRLVQGFGRCTRSPNDYAAVVILGETLNSYLLRKDRREFFHPEIQAELEFGLEQSKSSSMAEMLENLRHFLIQDTEWERADKAIVILRGSLEQHTLSAARELGEAVAAELSYEYAIWNADFISALAHCRTVISKLTHSDLRGYRALWLYLAGSAAWLAHRSGQLPNDDMAKDYFRMAQAAAPVLRWLVALQSDRCSPAETIFDHSLATNIERIELILDQMGTIHDRKYDAEEHAILDALLQNDDGLIFENGHERLGRLLGYDVGNSTEDGAPDPWWIADDSLCFVFEDHSAGKPDTIFSITKARQAASHQDWIQAKIPLAPDAEIISVLITPCSQTTNGAIPILRKLRYWNLEDFRTWAKNALQVLREIRREFPGSGDLVWRATATERLVSANIGPKQLKDLLSQSAAEAMVISAEEKA